MKKRRLVLLLFVPAIVFMIYANAQANAAKGAVEYPLCGGGYTTVPSGAGVYNGPCISTGRPIYRAQDQRLIYISFGVFGLVIVTNLLVQFGLKNTSPRGR